MLQSLSFVVRYIVESNDESMALLGVSLLQQLVQAGIGQVDEEGWQHIVDAFQQGCSFDTLASLLSDQSARWLSSICFAVLSRDAAVRGQSASCPGRLLP